MQKGQHLQFSCQGCQEPICFSLFELDAINRKISCENCQKTYSFDDEILMRQLKKFADLCQQLIDCEEILSHVAVGVDVGNHHVKIPYKLLLTRLNSHLDLMVGNHPLSITFRLEPLKLKTSKEEGQKDEQT